MSDALNGTAGAALAERVKRYEAALKKIAEGDFDETWCALHAREALAEPQPAKEGGVE